MPKPFEGIRILDFSRVVAAPYASSLLAFMGAEVIRIEEPGRGDNTRWGEGDPAFAAEGLSSSFIFLNAGKGSITLDLKTPEAVEIVKKLVPTADVVLENFRPGTMARFGAGYEDLKAINPRIVYCALTGFGQSGPESATPAYDGRIQAMSGIMSVTGHKETGPTRAGFAVADSVAGLNAALGIASALYQRTVTGEGQFVDVAMLDCAVSLLGPTAGKYLTGGIVPDQAGNVAISGQPTADLYPTAEGDILLAVNTERQVETLLRVIGREDLVSDPRFADRRARIENWDFVRGVVEEGLRKGRAADWDRRLNDAGAPCSKVLTIPEVVDHPQIRHRGLVFTVHDDKLGRDMRLVNAGFTLAHGTPGTDRPPPRLGQDNERILAEIGYGPDEIARLREAGVI